MKKELWVGSWKLERGILLLAEVVDNEDRFVTIGLFANDSVRVAIVIMMGWKIVL